MDKTSAPSAKESVILFIQKFRVLIVVVGIVLVAAIVAAIVLDEVQKSRLAASSVLIERLNDSYSAWSAASETDKVAKKTDLDSAVTEAMSFGSYPKQRADYIEAEVSFASKDFATAETRFLAAVEESKDSYLAPVALMNAAIAAEEAGKVIEAKSYLERLAADYAKSSSLAPRALFNIGRLAEESQQWNDAKTSYQKILDEYASSSWTKLARDRIIYLKVQNKT